MSCKLNWSPLVSLPFPLLRSSCDTSLPADVPKEPLSADVARRRPSKPARGITSSKRTPVLLQHDGQKSQKRCSDMVSHTSVQEKKEIGVVRGCWSHFFYCLLQITSLLYPTPRPLAPAEGSSETPSSLLCTLHRRGSECRRPCCHLFHRWCRQSVKL